MPARRTLLIVTALIVLGLSTAPSAAAHEHYMTDDGKYSLVIGEQGEPVYTYDWTGLDLIVRENATKGPVPGVHRTVNATLLGPDGTELSMPLEPQFDEQGRYEFKEGYILTQPGQYQLRLEGHINGTDVTGTYDLPGPRKSWSTVSFPDDGIPSVLDLEEGQQALKDRVDGLQQRVDQLEQRVDRMGSDGGSGDGSMPSTAGFTTSVALVTVAAVAFMLGRRYA